MRKFFVALASGLPVAFAVFLSGCNSMSQVSPSSSVPLVDPTPVISRRTNLVPRELKLKLTLDNPADLKVKQGNHIQKGQVISDRTSARTQLEQQRQTIRLKLGHMNAAGSNPVSDVVERARVRQAQIKAEQARRAITQFKAHSPWTDYAWVSLPLDKDLAQVSQLEAKVREAEMELDLAVAQLQAFREKNPVGQDTLIQRVLLQSQIREIEEKLDRVSVVRSPYAGIIKKIKWIGQANQELMVEVTLMVHEPDKAL